MNHRTKSFSVAWILALCMFMAACGPRRKASCLDRLSKGTRVVPMSWSKAADGETLTLIDGDHNQVLPCRPKRIVSTLPGITEMIAFLGATHQLVAVSPHCNEPPEVTALTKVSVRPLAVEALRMAKPDLVIVDRRLHAPDVPALRRFSTASKIHVLALRSSRTVDELVQAMSLLAAVIDTPEALRQAKRWKRDVEIFVKSVRARSAVKPVRMVAIAYWDPLYVFFPGSLMDDLMRICGGINIACDVEPSASGTFDEELILVRKPVWMLSHGGPLPEALRARWQRVPAVREGNVIDVSGDLFARGGPRILEALKRLDAALHAPPAGK